MGTRTPALSTALANDLQWSANNSRASWYLDARNASLDTWPTDRLGKALGFNGDAIDIGGIDALCAYLAGVGFRYYRVEASYDSFDPPSGTDTSAGFAQSLRSCRTHGLRPLLTFNSDTGVPCPITPAVVTFTQPVAQGATTAYFSGLTVGGQAAIPSALVQRLAFTAPGASYYGGAALLDSVAQVTTGPNAGSYQATLSRPCPAAIPAGPQPLGVFLTKPFSGVPLAGVTSLAANGSDNAASQNAFVGQFIAGVCAQAMTALGTTGQPDCGFDVEITNEGGNATFLNINNYYAAPVCDPSGVEGSLWAAALAEVHQVAPGATCCTGFTNTNAYDATGRTADAMSVHPYPIIESVSPAAPGYETGQQQIDALGNPDGTPYTGPGTGGFCPTTALAFPEWYLTNYQVESMNRFVSALPIPYFGGVIDRASWGAKHFWNTENGMCLASLGGVTDLAGWTLGQSRRFKAKALLRMLLGFVHAGYDRMYLFAACDSEPQGYGFCNFQASDAAALDAGQPPSDSPFIAALRNALARMPAPSFHTPRPLWLQSVSDAHGNSQFAGDGTPAHPTVYDRDVVRLLPFQATDHAWVCFAYVETRNLAQPHGTPGTDTYHDLPAEAFDLLISGPNPEGLAVTAYDPYAGVPAPVSFSPAPGGVTLHVSLTDAPLMIFLQEAPLPSINWIFRAVNDAGSPVEGLVFNTTATTATVSPPGVKALCGVTPPFAPVTPLPAISCMNTGNGLYAFQYDANALGEAAIVIDLGTNGFSGDNRYRYVQLTADSGTLMAQSMSGNAQPQTEFAAVAQEAMVSVTIPPGRGYPNPYTVHIGGGLIDLNVPVGVPTLVPQEAHDQLVKNGVLSS